MPLGVLCDRNHLLQGGDVHRSNHNPSSNYIPQQEPPEKRQKLTRSPLQAVSEAYSVKPQQVVENPTGVSKLQVELRWLQPQQMRKTLSLQYMSILADNMQAVYGREWNRVKAIKKRQLKAKDARFLLAIRAPTSAAKHCSASLCGQEVILGFVQYRFVVEDEVEVAYVYELQVSSTARGQGLGKLLLHQIETLGRTVQMCKLMLTVQAVNTVAISFYRGLGLTEDPTSPGVMDPDGEYTYHIMSKSLS